MLVTLGTDSDLELAAIGAYLPELRRSLAGQGIAYQFLAAGFILGLVAHVVGYLLRTIGAAEPIGLVIDLLYALGLSLWTGVVVAMFVQLLPEAKRRQIKRVLDAYAALRRKKPAGEGDPPPSAPSR